MRDDFDRPLTRCQTAAWWALSAALLAVFLSAALCTMGCKATGNWSLKRDGDGLAYTCEPFAGEDHCGWTFDLEVLTRVLEHLERMFGKIKHTAEGGPPDGRDYPPPTPLVGDSPAGPPG